ncbi:hypothetical protein I2486_02710 [Cellulophaga sp. E16_2]|uniref:DUF6588 family protein n=1 Tax=Cellulophaga sp. E16_2 TaxID=2789297 RepID=UPI001A926B3F|nr:DUF6588 family protein [Cellulophaga sp. E16_2]MBO0590307.1 hypothetical protein [Cellulophaga sp. E16_2]
MKHFFLLLVLISGLSVTAQADINNLFAAGVDDAERFTNDYMAPLSEGMIYSISNGWYNSGETKPLGGFEISIIGNMASFKNKENKKSFDLNTAEYENIQFVDGSISKAVSSGLGDLEGIRVFVEGEVAPGVSSREEFELPTGLSSENINFVPSAFLQVSVGLIKGIELKARFLPKIDTDEVAVGFYGVGLQHELTSLLPAEKIWPVAVSGVIGYTHLNGTYDFTDTEIIAGENQKIDTKINSWNFQAVVSTKLPIINFYGGLGYITGNSKTDVLGTYIVQSGPFQQTIEDPFTLTKKVSGATANIGTKLKLGFFRLHADYTIAQFNSLSVGINFGFR